MKPARSQPASWTTPQILQVGQAGVFATSLLMMTVIILSAQSHRRAVQGVGKDSAPSIIAAQHIRAALADMDANAANELLLPESAVNERVEARKIYENRRKEAVESLVTAAGNITYEAERKPVQTLALATGTYTAMMQRARDLHDARDKRFVEEWRAAAQFMDTTILSAATELDQANRKELDRLFAEQNSRSGGLAMLTFVAGLLVMGLLGGLQMFLTQRMRRVLNPMLLAATACALLLTGYSLSAFRAQDRHLKIAKEDAFESLHALWQARSLSYSANSDESRYLLDPEQSAAHEKAFTAKTDQIRNTYFANELKNITFEGEEAAAKEMVQAYQQYLAIDTKIRDLQRAGQHEAAVTLCTGNGQNQSNFVFDRFAKALDRTLAVNQKAFDEAVAAGFADVAGFEIVAPLGALAIAVLTWLGLKPRLREYV